MPSPIAAPTRRSLALAATVILGVVWLGGTAGAADAQTTKANAVFDKILSALNSSSGASISGCICDAQVASFTFKSGATGGNLTAAKATKRLKKWFDAGAKGGGWKKIKVYTTGTSNPWATYQRKSDGRNLTVTLKTVKTKLYLFKFAER